ncbi:MAG: PAS domain S-box protein [Candidatus Neomarinimicrobiota bacterium]
MDRISDLLHQIAGLEQRVRASEERYLSVAENSPTGILITNNSFQLVYANKRLSTILGYSFSELIGMDFRELLDDDSRELVIERYLRRQRLEEVPSQYDFNIICKNGERKRVEVNSAILHDDEGRIYTVAHLLDVSDSWQAIMLQSAVFKISEAVSATKDMPSLFQSIHRIMGSILDVTNFFIALYDEQQQLITFPYFIDEVDPPPEPQKFGDGLTEYIIKTGEPLYVTEAGIYELAQNGKIDLLGTPSIIWMGSPLRIENRIIGVVVVQTYRDAALYNRDDLHILNYVSEQIATSIRNKQAEEALNVEKSHFEGLFQTSPEAIVLVDRSSIIRRINSEFTRLFGYTAAEAIGKNIDNLITDAQRFEEARATTRKVAGGERIRFETIRFRKDGSPVHVSILSAPVVTHEGSQAVYAIYRDITERKQAEELIKASEEKYRLLVESVNDAIVISQHDKFIFFNRRFMDMLGYSYEELQTKDYREIYTPAGIQILQDRKRLRDRGEPVPDRYETSFKKKDGTVINIEAHVVIIDYHDDAATFAVLNDITERKKGERKLIASEKKYRQLSTQLAHTNDFKDLLLDVITHDLKNPAGVISGMAELLESEYPELAGIDIIRESSNNLLKVIENAVTLSKVTIGEEIDREQIDLTDLIRTIAREFSQSLKQAGMSITVNIDEPLPVLANPIIAEVFRNYISNAIKYAAAGGEISITAQEDATAVTIRVNDFGTVIPEASRHQIFGRTVQLAREEKRGRGLGLAIVDRIAKAHKAAVWVEPNRPTGNSFCLKIPRT